MANTERMDPMSAPGFDEPLVRAADGVRSDVSTPWFIRQARKMSAAGERRSRSAAGLKSVAADTGVADDADVTIRPRRAAPSDGRFGPLPDLLQAMAPEATAAAPTTVAAAPRTKWAARHWPNLAFAAVLVMTAAAGWLFRGVETAPQATLSSPPSVPAPLPRNASTAPPPLAAPVLRPPAPPRAETVAAVPTLPLPTGFTRQAAALGAPDNAGSRSTATRAASLPVPVDRASERSRSVAASPRSRVVAATPRRRAVTAACAGLGRGGAYLVCTRPQLAEFDRILTRMSAQTVATGDPRAQRRLAKTSARFLARRNRCTTAPCVARLYERRLDAVSDYLRDGIKAAAKREVRQVKTRQ